MTLFLLIVAIVLLVILIFLVTKKSIHSKDIEEGVSAAWAKLGLASTIEAAISTSWIKLGLDQTIGAVATHAKNIADSHKSIEQMLKVPQDRASLGEIALETILSDQLPPDMFGIRQKVLDGKIPDAYIKSTVGLICIDSKFPLENYKGMLDAPSESEKDTYKRTFIRRDVNNHLEKIYRDYVCPEKGSAEFAFAYIPSEAVYYFLVNDGYELLRDFSKKGVQVVSPLTLSTKIELIKAGVHAKKLSEDAEKVRKQLISLSGRFGEVDITWHTLYSTHMKNMMGKADELDRAYKKLSDEFENVSKLSE